MDLRHSVQQALGINGDVIAATFDVCSATVTITVQLDEKQQALLRKALSDMHLARLNEELAIGK